ncbi:hypothetical protein D0Z00_003788 [Geotrichum galactomycetum]|uniref:Uncharacterized protein n=1 Tax=Geotrichum galactomycetum TaxID=27317 RepID=A0ACB6V0B9_9ASCO|nr:hypothetical protein D0Z00_003788 [Geotrichum candidum]
MDHPTPYGLTPEEEEQGETPLPTVELSESNVSGADLPEYSTGAQITRAPTEPEQSALSRLNQHLHSHHHHHHHHNHNNPADDDRLTSALTIRVDRTRFSLGDIIQGTIMFVPWRKKDSNQPQGISGVNLLLVIKETTFSNSSSNTNLACSQTYKLGYHIVPEMAMPPDGTVSTGYIYSFPFSVQVPNVKVSPNEASQQLPDYTLYYTSTTTTHSSSSRVGLGAVLIELDQTNAHIYDIEDLVTGNIIFTPKRDTIVSHAYATLSGEESSSCTKRQLNLGKFIVPIKEAAATSSVGLPVKKGRTYRFRFSIQIPMTVHSIDHHDNNNEDSSIEDNKGAHMSTLMLIPPSLGPTPDLGIETTHGVSYFVSACVQEAAAAVPTSKSHFCNLPAFVILCPSYPAQLSSGNDTTVEKIRDNDKKIETTVAVARRSGLLKRQTPHGAVQVRVIEPVVVNLDKSAGDVSGAVQLQLVYTASASSPPPPQITQVNTTLSAITTDAHGITTAEPLPLVEHPVLRPHWCSNTHTAALAVPVSVPFHTNALPTFASALLTRRYEMRVAVTIKGSTAAAAVLHVPVLLVASAIPRHYFGYLETWVRVAAEQRATDRRAAPRQSLSKAALIELEANDGAGRAELACYQ